MQLEELQGELWWVRTKEPEEFNGKRQWKCMIRPTQEGVMKLLDLQSKGVKNMLKKDEKGYYINFNRPTERKNKAGVVVQKFEAPKVYNTDGTEFDGLVGNGSEGSIKLEIYQHATPTGGKAHAARLWSIHLTKLVEYGSANTTAEAY